MRRIDLKTEEERKQSFSAPNEVCVFGSWREEGNEAPNIWILFFFWSK